MNRTWTSTSALLGASAIALFGCGAATQDSPSSLPVEQTADAPSLRAERPASTDVEAAMALLDVLDAADISTEGSIRIWSEGGTLRWGLAEEEGTNVRVSVGFRAYVSEHNFPETITIREAVERITSFAERLDRAEPHIRMFAMGVHSDGMVSVMTLALARKARAEGERQFVQPLVELALRLPHASHPFGAGLVDRLRGDLALELLKLASMEYGDGEPGAMARARARLDIVTGLEGTEAAQSAAELRSRMWNAEDQADPAQLLLRGNAQQQQFEAADFAGKVAMLLPLLDDERALPRRGFRGSLMRVGQAALSWLSELVGGPLPDAAAAREWWANARADNGYADALSRIESRDNYGSVERLVTRLVDADRARAKRDLVRVYGRLEGHRRYGLVVGFVEAFGDEATPFLRRIASSRDPVDREVIAIVSGHIEISDPTIQRQLRRAFEAAARADDLGSREGELLTRAMANRRENALLASHWGDLPTRTRQGLIHQAAQTELAVAALEDDGLLLLSMCGGTTGADMVAEQVARAMQREYDCEAPLPERVAAQQELAAALRTQLSMATPTPVVPNFAVIEGEGFRIHVDDPRNLLELEPLAAHLGAGDADGVMRFLNGLVRSGGGRPMLVFVAFRRRASGALEGEVHVRRRRQPSDLRWDAMVRGENEQRFSASQFTPLDSPLLHGAGVWSPLRESLTQLLAADGPVRSVALELYF